MEYTGSSYEGQHLNGRLEGEGEYTFPTGTIYKGERVMEAEAEHGISQ